MLTAVSAKSAFDPARLVENLDGDRESVRIVLEAFMEELPGYIRRLEEALMRSKSADGAYREAHALKGAAANVGALRITEHADRIGEACRSGNLPAAQTMLLRMPWLADEFGSRMAEFMRQPDLADGGLRGSSS